LRRTNIIDIIIFKKEAGMFSRKYLFLIFTLLIFYSPVFAEGLTSTEVLDYFNQGVKAQKEGDFFKANTFYQKVLLIEPNNLNYQKYIANNRAVEQMNEGDLDNAEATFNQILKSDPNYKPAQLNLGFIYEMRQDKLKAIEYWLKILNIKLDNLKPKALVLEEQKEEEVKK
jgi:tetratricopeptide (TPR) repeat protein